MSCESRFLFNGGSKKASGAYMPLLQYFFGVGTALLCLMFVLDAYVPKAPAREQRELDKSTIRITARPSDEFVIDRFPPVHGNVAAGPSDAVRQALAMMPDGDVKQAGVAAAPEHGRTATTPRKRRVVQRSQTRLANGEVPSPSRSQSWSGNNWSQGWSNNWNSNWSQGWSNNRSGNWSQGWTNNRGSNGSQGWTSKRWANNQWTSW